MATEVKLCDKCSILCARIKGHIILFISDKMAAFNSSIDGFIWPFSDAPYSILFVFVAGPLIVFASLLLIMRLRYNLPLTPYGLLTQLVMRMPHNYSDLPSSKKNKYNAESNESLSKLWRMIMIEDLSKSLKHDKPKEESKVKYIYGECSDTVTIEHALYNGLSVDLVFGPQIRDASSRKRLAYLKEKYPEKLNVYSISSRPIRHAVKISNNILIEDFHPVDVDYRMSTSLEDASERVSIRFNEYFDNLKQKSAKGRALTKDEIMNTETLDEFQKRSQEMKNSNQNRLPGDNSSHILNKIT